MKTKRWIAAGIAALSVFIVQADIVVFYGLNNTLNPAISGSGAGAVSATDISATFFARSDTTILSGTNFLTGSGGGGIVAAPVEGSHYWRAGNGNGTTNPAGAAGPEGTNIFLSFTFTNNHATDAVLITGFDRWVGANTTSSTTASFLTDIVVGAQTTSLGLYTLPMVTNPSASLSSSSLGPAPDFSSITLAAGQTATVRQWVGSTLSGRYWYFDNMTVTLTAIPEPGTLALVGISLGGLLLFRRRGK